MNITDRAQKVIAEIDAALALAEKATPGPWHQDFSIVITTYSNPEICDCDGYSVEQDEDNAAFVAASRTLLPTSLRCLKTAIETFDYLSRNTKEIPTKVCCVSALTTLCDQFENNL